jgi:hypothetical protein
MAALYATPDAAARANAWLPVDQLRGRVIASTDPRSRYDSTLRPWFVVFDGPAATFAGLSATARAFCSGNHYLLVTTDSHAVPPALSRTSPTRTQAVDRLRLLGCLGSAVAWADWYTVPGWHFTVPRVC